MSYMYIYVHHVWINDEFKSAAAMSIDSACVISQFTNERDLT